MLAGILISIVVVAGLAFALPWVTSQRFGGQSTNLFRLHLIDAGAGPSKTVKFSIENIAPSSDPAYSYGTFDLIVREWDDRDTDQRPVEQWRQLSLDPSSDRYLAKVIGDLHAFYDFDRAESAQKLAGQGGATGQLPRLKGGFGLQPLAGQPGGQHQTPARSQAQQHVARVIAEGGNQEQEGREEQDVRPPQPARLRLGQDGRGCGAACGRACLLRRIPAAEPFRHYIPPDQAT